MEKEYAESMEYSKETDTSESSLISIQNSVQSATLEANPEFGTESFVLRLTCRSRENCQSTSRALSLTILQVQSYQSS